MTNLDSMLKSRHITLLKKVCIIKAIFFPVVMYGYESWTIKKRTLNKRMCKEKRMLQTLLKELLLVKFSKMKSITAEN